MGKKRQHIPEKMRQVIVDEIVVAATKRRLAGCGAAGLADHVNNMLGTTVKKTMTWKIALELDLADHFRARKAGQQSHHADPVQLDLPGGEADRLWNEIKSINQRLFDIAAQLDAIKRP